MAISVLAKQVTSSPQSSNNEHNLTALYTPLNAIADQDGSGLNPRLLV